MPDTHESRALGAGLSFSDAPAAVANNVPTHVAGNLLFVSG